MGADYIVTLVLLCFLFNPCYLTLVESVGVDGHLQMNQKISPSLYHNRDIRFFTYWTKDLKSKGCYNSQCTGYVPASGAKLVPGQAIAPPSVYGIQDHYMRISINKDPNSGDWVVYHHDLEKPSFLGHFPKELCLGTKRIQAMTGFVNYLKNAHGPPMGSGHFPDYNEKKSAYFNHIKNYNSKGQAFDPFWTKAANFLPSPERTCWKDQRDRQLCAPCER
ncbi:unnamed protein product [Triticum turgidum subsp. durum]|uniref:Neprosin PEP catalytic domain-containing protein n=1 Tax=Triticum turgidum subsp. durum TaxID=4567 RepID=A0A9R0XBD6_TRITD|nr:unnamed protein product [Triticum turgidum subsp. durum]